MCVCVQETSQLTDLVDSSRASLDREKKARPLFFAAISHSYFPFFCQNVFFLSIRDKWNRASPLYATVDVLIVSAESKTWLDSMRPLLKIIALSDKQNSGENGEKWRNNHQILSRFSSQVGGQQGIGGHCWENVFADRREFILNWGLDRTAPICRPSVQKK